MLMVTENAKRHLKRLLVKNASDPNLGIRLRVGTGMQLGVLLDRKADDDYVVEHEGAKVLMVGPEFFSLVDGAVLDTERNSPLSVLNNIRCHLFYYARRLQKKRCARYLKNYPGYYLIYSRFNSDLFHSLIIYKLLYTF